MFSLVSIREFGVIGPEIIEINTIKSTTAESASADFSASYRFSKRQRLLDAAGYQNVFSDPPFRASHRHCLILAKPNALPYDRLGLIVAKKHVRLAVHRNRIKRLIRENFRCRPRNVYGIDAIVLARKGLGELDSAVITQIVNQQWLRIQNKMSMHR